MNEVGGSHLDFSQIHALLPGIELPLHSVMEHKVQVVKQ